MRQGKRARSLILMTAPVRRSRPSDEARSARGAIARLRVMRAGGRTLVLLAVLLAALAGNARAATAPFIPIDLGTLGGSDSAALAVNARGQVVGYSSMTRYGAETRAFSWTQAGGMIDLGTLGGMNSLAEAVNDRGQVVGWSDTPADTGVGVACCSVSRAFSWTQAGGMLDLGTLGGSSSTALAVNASGQVVGYADAVGNAASHAFSWTLTGGMIDLSPNPHDGRFSAALAVNTNGQAVGYTYAAGDGSDYAFSWTPTGGMTSLSFGGTSGLAEAVSDYGQVVGWLEPAIAEYHAFTWTPTGGMIDLGTLGGSASQAVAVNASGQVVGASYTAGDSATRAFSWTAAAGMIDLGTLGGSSSSAEAVNASGQVVGAGDIVGNAAFHAFSWTPAGGMIDLGTLGGTNSLAFAVNDRGEVVGYSEMARSNPRDAPDYHAVLWQPIVNLGCQATLAGCNLAWASLAGAYLKGGNLSGANLKRANLVRANLSGANLSGANLKGADLASANLARANLTGANVAGIRWSNTVCPDGTNSDADGGTCLGHLSGAN